MFSQVRTMGTPGCKPRSERKRAGESEEVNGNKRGVEVGTACSGPQRAVQPSQLGLVGANVCNTSSTAHSSLTLSARLRDQCPREAKGVFKCGRCRCSYYCCREHQRLDSADHADVCRNYAVVSSADQGEYLEATCLILPGNLIFTEEPLLVGPLANSDLVCLSCYKPITDKDFYRCPDCKWPVCNKVCANASPHWAECGILAKDEAGIGVPQHHGMTPRYDLIMLLRGLLLKETNPRAWKIISSMQSHAEKRKCADDPFHTAAVRYFTEVCGAGFDEDDIHQVRGAIMTNCMVFKSCNNTSLRALHAQFRLFNHSCIPNISISTTPDGEITARASVTIEKREPLCITYTGTMEPLWQRQKYLSDVYKFQCQCKRCMDPKELGTYFSSPRCPDCRRSFMLPPGDGSFDFWVCETCGLRYELIDVMQEVSEWLHHMDMNDVINKRTVRQLSKDVDRIQDSFNSLHYVPLQFTQNLLRAMKEETYETFKLRQEIWENHLEICNKLEPGKTRRRGMLLFQLAATILAMVKAGVAEKEIYLPRVPHLLQEAKPYLHEAENIFQLEPKASLERRWIYSIVSTYEEIKFLECKFHVESEQVQP